MLLLLHLSALGAAAASQPCDILALAGNDCVAAHSTVRALYAAYAGPLYRVARPDNVSAPWKAATGTAKGLRVLSGDVGRLALRAHAAFDALVYALTPGFILPVSPADVRQKLELLLALSFGEELITADVRDRLGTVLGRGEVGKLLAPLPV